MNDKDVKFVESCTDINELRSRLHDNAVDSISYDRTKERIEHLRSLETQQEQRKTNKLTIAILALTIVLTGLTIALVISEFNISPNSPYKDNQSTENNTPQDNPKPVAK